MNFQVDVIVVQCPAGKKSHTPPESSLPTRLRRPAVLMLSTFLFSVRIHELARLATNVGREMAQNLWAHCGQRARWSPEDLRSKGRSSCKVEFRTRPTAASADQHSTGEIAPAAVDNFSANRYELLRLHGVVRNREVQVALEKSSNG